MNASMTQSEVDHLFRRTYGKVVAALSHYVGLTYLSEVEDIVQEAFIQALKTWPKNGMPHQPEAWIMTTAKRKAIDLIRKKNAQKSRDQYFTQSGPASIKVEEIFSEKEISDNQLRMMFSCCHPSLSIQDQVSLVLKVVSGFSIREIANGLHQSEETLKKRLQRARQTLKKQGDQLKIPTGQDLAQRRDAVASALYLLFNEGYFSQSEDMIIRYDLCYESMRLIKLMCHHNEIVNGSVQALLAMMCFHTARFESRTNEHGQIIVLSEQDRSQWNRQLIGVGQFYLRQAYLNLPRTSYHIEAAISFEHCSAKTYDDTNWHLLRELYRELYALRPQSNIRINEAIVCIELGMLEASKKILEEVPIGVHDEFLWHCAQAHLFDKMKNPQLATNHLQEAIKRSQVPAQIRLLEKRITKIAAAG